MMPRLHLVFGSGLVGLTLLASSTSALEPKSFDRLSAMHVWGDSLERPVPIDRVEPKYPSNIKIRLSGLAIVEVWIRADGTVAHAKSLKPLPLGIDEAAAEAVRKWRYAPGKVGGVSVPVVYNQAVPFNLH